MVNDMEMFADSFGPTISTPKIHIWLKATLFRKFASLDVISF